MIRVALLTTITIGTVLGLVALWYLREALVLFLLSLAVAAAVRPLVDRLARKLPRPIGVTGTYVLGLAVLVVALVLVGQLLLGDLGRVGSDYLEVLEYITTQWPQGSRMQQMAVGMISPPEQAAAAFTPAQGGTIGQAVLGTAFSVLGSAIDLLVVVVLSVYWTIDRVHFERLWLSLLPLEQRTWWRSVWRSMEEEVGAYFRSEGAQSLAAGLFLGLTYWLLGLPYPTLLAVLAALGWLIPWVGVVVVLAGILILSPPLVLHQDGWAVVTLAASAVITLAVFFFLERFMESRFFDRRRYNSLLMAIAMVALAETFGILGLVFGPPLAIALQIAVEEYMRRRITVSTETAAPSLTIEERLKMLQAQVTALGEAPPELTTMVQRLQALVAGANEVAPAAAETSPVGTA